LLGGFITMDYQIKSQLSREGSLIYIYDSAGEETALNSLYSPTKEINRFMKEIEDLQKKFVVIIGVGNGVVVEKLIQSDSLDKNVHFLIIEPYSEVVLSDDTKNIINKNRKISFFYLNKFSAILFSRFLSKFTSISTSIHIHPNYLKANKSIIESIIELLKEGVRIKKILNNTEQKFAIDWIIEPLLNLEAMEKSNNIQQFRGEFSGETAILVAAGPSLKKKIPFIKKMQDSCHIFCVGPALRPLLKNNIKPDYVLSIDSSEINYETHFKDLNYDGTLIFETMSNHNIQKNHKGSMIASKALGENLTTLLFNDNSGFSHSAPSVAIFTLEVIQHLGFSKVYLVGQDLALINGEYYSEGIKKHNGTNYSNVDLMVENNKGEKIETTRALKLFLDVFEWIISTFPENSMEIYNTSEYGAKIKGTRFVQAEHIENLLGRKKEILVEGDFFKPNQSVPNFINDFLSEMKALEKLLKLHLEKIKGYTDTREITKEEQLDLLVAFKEISGNKIIEEILLSNLTFIFDNIINKVVYFDHKQEYSHEDLFELLNELANLYKVIIKYIEEILADSRIQKYL
jgi:hypothetical protein